MVTVAPDEREGGIVLRTQGGPVIDGRPMGGPGRPCQRGAGVDDTLNFQGYRVKI